MEWLLIWRKWEGSALYWSKGWFLLHSNVPSHNAATVKHILATRKVAVPHNPSYSSDLAPANYFILPQIHICPERSEIPLHNRYSRSGYKGTEQHSKSFLEWIKKLHECAIRCIKTRWCVCWKNNSFLICAFVIFIIFVLKLFRHTLYTLM